MSILTERFRWLGIEFVVIALGVLSALLVDTWIQDREDARRSAEYRASLIADLATDIENLGERVSYYSFILRTGLELIEVLEGRAEMDDATLMYTAFNAAEEWDFVEQSSTFIDMRSTGHLALLGDLKLRLELARYYQEMAPRERLWALPDDYRRVARGIIPNDFQNDVHGLCTNIGDTEAREVAAVWDIDWVVTFNDISCLGDVSRYNLADAARRLHQHNELVSLLRYRMSQATIAVRLFQGQIAAAEKLKAKLASID